MTLRTRWRKTSSTCTSGYPALDLVQIVLGQPLGRFWLVSRLTLRLVRSLETAR